MDILFLSNWDIYSDVCSIWMCVKLANCLALQPLTSIGKVCLLKENFEHTMILKNYELLKPVEINV